jgi:outer membrane protein insertion porin family
LDGITFKHNKAIADADALRGLFPIKDGDIFSREKVGIGLENLRKAYGEMGYINFTSIPNTTFADERKLIYLDSDVDEGKQFFGGSVNIIGLNEVARQKLLKDLLITGGQIYNGRLWDLSWRLAAKLTDCGCANRQAVAVDEKAGLVTLTFDFRPCIAAQ